MIGLLSIWTPGAWEIVIILLVVLLLFGGKKLPELARGLARGLRTFKDEMMGIKTDVEQSEETKPPQEHEQAAQGQEQAQQGEGEGEGEGEEKP